VLSSGVNNNALRQSVTTRSLLSHTLTLVITRHTCSSHSQEFRKNLIGLTDVTHNSFDKLVAQLERGFEDMDK
jgi:hypothetical protein